MLYLETFHRQKILAESGSLQEPEDGMSAIGAGERVRDVQGENMQPQEPKFGGKCVYFSPRNNSQHKGHAESGDRSVSVSFAIQRTGRSFKAIE